MRYLLLLLFISVTPVWSNSLTTEGQTSIQNKSISIEEEEEKKKAEAITLNSPHSEINSSLQQREITKDGDSNYLVIQVIISLISTIIPIVVSYYVKRKSDEVMEKINMRDMKLRTSNIVLSKRLEVFPKLHIRTDKLGATIRYYKKHRNILELKTGLRDFYLQLSDWDAKYCIFAGATVTNCIAALRRKLEEEDSWIEINDTSEITDQDIEWIYISLQNLEKALKEEMAVFFTSFEENEKNEDREHYIEMVK